MFNLLSFWLKSLMIRGSFKVVITQFFIVTHKVWKSLLSKDAFWIKYLQYLLKQHVFILCNSQFHRISGMSIKFFLGSSSVKLVNNFILLNQEFSCSSSLYLNKQNIIFVGISTSKIAILWTCRQATVTFCAQISLLYSNYFRKNCFFTSVNCRNFWIFCKKVVTYMKFDH